MTESAPDALARFARAIGEAREASANRPIRLNDAGRVWFVERGAIDVLVTEIRDGRIEAPFRHVTRLEAGRLAFGASEAEHSLRLVAKGLQGTRVRRLPVARVLEALREQPDPAALRGALIAKLDAWIEEVASSFAREVESRPRPEVRLRPGSEVAGGSTSAERGVCWVEGEGLDATFLDLTDSRPDGPGLMAVTRDTWIAVHRPDGVACRSSGDLDLKTLLTAALPEFHRLALGAASIHRRLLLVDDANLQAEQAARRRGDKARARSQLAGLYDARVPTEGGAPLEAALRMVARHEGLRIRAPSGVAPEGPSLADYCEASGVRERRVRLSDETRWWTGDSGAMLAYRKDDDAPVALLPGPGGRYRVVDAATGESRPAGPETGSELRDVRMLYPRLPTDGAVRLRGLFRVGGAKVRTEVVRLVAAGLGAGVLAMAPAVAVALLIGTVIPSGDVAMLAQFSAVLVGLALVAALAHILRGTALMRLEGQVAARLGAAVFDRLLRLPARFFRDFSAGDLASRALIFQDLRDRVSGVAADAVLSTIFVLPALGVIFFFSPALGLATAGVGVVALGVTAAFCVSHIRPQRRYLEVSRKLSGDMQQFLTGISKLRATGAEDSAFAAWARLYRIHKRTEIRLGVLHERLVALSAGVPAVASAILFAVVASAGLSRLATGDFLAVHTAAMVLSMSLIMLANAVRVVAIVPPACEQVRPILQSPAHVGSGSSAGLKLEGEILLDEVSFGYPGARSNVLENVSIHARPGEFVAIVGESGAGKSTLLRLALGLETPSLGAVYYDGRDLAHLDVGALRRQVGVVTQDGSLQNGTILDNIIGVGNDLTADDAWTAARKAAVDEDIRAMPMGLHTTVGENAATFSGGQSQRIRIAGALVRNPRLLFLDEPTSWLDTRSQALTMKGIVESDATRFVIAHRLSTIRLASRIYVLEGGRVVQTGGFEELLEVEGPFRDLALRQIA